MSHAERPPTNLDVSPRPPALESHLDDGSAFYRMLAANLPGGAVFVVDKDLRYVLAEGQALIAAGYSPANFLGKTLREVLEPNLLEPYELNYRKALAGQPFHLEHRSHGRDYDTHGMPLRDASGQVMAVLVTSYDITERKRAEKNLGFLAELSQDFEPFASEEDIMNGVGEKLGRYLELSRCNFSIVDMANDRITAIYDWRREASTPSVLGEHRIATFLTELGKQHYASGKIAIVNDSRNHPMMNAKPEMLATLHIGSVVDAPYLENGQWKFLLSACRPKPCLWRDDEVALIRELAARIYIRLQRARAEAALRESEDRLQMALNAMSMGTFVWHVQEDCGEPDRQMLRLFGLEASDTLNLSKALDTLIHPDDRARSHEAVARATDPSGPGELHEDIRLILADGTVRWLAITARTVFEGEPRQAVYMNGSAVDITRQKLAETGLRESEERLRTLADVVMQVIWANDANGKATYFNKRWHDYTGLSRDQSVGQGWQAIVHPDDASISMARWRHALAAGDTFDTEFRLRRADGVYRWHIGRSVPLRDDTGRIISWFGTATDIEDMKRAQSDMRESEERFRMLVEGVRDYAMFLMDTSRRIIHWNSGAERLFGFSREEAIGHFADMIFTPEDRAAHKPEEEMQTALVKGRATDRRWHLRRSGERFWTDGLMMSLRNELGQLRGFVKIARDATREREAEEDLRHAHGELEVRVAERTAELEESREQLRQLSVHTEQAREAERTRIAREVHDELGGGLTGLKLQLGALEWSRESDAALCQTLREARNHLDQLVETVRRIASDLRPPLLDDLGLLPAMDWHALEWRKRTNIMCVLDLLETEPPLSRDQRTAIFRVFQEALTNVARHANATHVMGTMTLDDSILALTIEDDGVGIEPSAIESSTSLGLMGMQERMREVGGTVEINGQAGAGTTVHIRVPI